MSARALHIVMVAPFGMQPKGTASARALPLGQALVARGHRVTLLVPPWDDRSAAGTTRTENGVEVRQVPLPPHAALDLPWLTARLLREAARLRPTLLHTFKPKAYSSFVALAWWLWRRLGQRAPLVTDTDDWEGQGGWNDVAGYSWLQRRLFAWQEQWGLRHHDGLTVASRELERIALGMGVPPARLCYLPNGPGADWPPPNRDEVEALRQHVGLGESPTALLFTRFAEFDPAQMVRRWATVVSRMPTARLLVVGQGLAGEDQRFARAVAELGVSDTVVVRGWQPREALPAHFGAADVALYPMRDTLLNRAKCPVKLADYLAAGLPVVGEAVGQVSEYLAPDTGGLLVPPGDDEAFVAATVRLLRDPAQAERLGTAGRARLDDHFAWPVQAARAERFYRALLTRPSGD